MGRWSGSRVFVTVLGAYLALAFLGVLLLASAGIGPDSDPGTVARIAGRFGRAMLGALFLPLEAIHVRFFPGRSLPGNDWLWIIGVGSVYGVTGALGHGLWSACATARNGSTEAKREDEVQRMSREEEKAIQNVWVFETFAPFAAAQGLRVRSGSVESRRPREPDILCQVEGEGPVAFELVELVDSVLREEESVATRKNRSASAVWTSDTTMERIRRKLFDKTYLTPHPMELLAWANPMITPPSAWMPMYESELRALRGVSGFRRIWVANLGGPPDERGVWFVDPPLR